MPELGGGLPGNKICFWGRAVLLSFCRLQGGGEQGLSAYGLGRRWRKKVVSLI